ncbi:MAG: hypothetical protein ACT4QB_23805 [Gammaproteobacteria bacterium]
MYLPALKRAAKSLTLPGDRHLRATGVRCFGACAQGGSRPDAAATLMQAISTQARVV